MSGYHAVAVKGGPDAVEVIRTVYEVGDRDPVERSGTGEFPGYGAEPGTAIAARVAGWTVVCGDVPVHMLEDDETARLADLSRDRVVVRWATESVTGAIGLDVFDNGEHRRGFWQMEGEVSRNVGAPLPGEPPGGFQGLEPYDMDEWKIVEVMEPYVASWDELAQAEYERFQFRPGGGRRVRTSIDPPAARPWWKFW
jgi:hypothetical protein